MTNQLSLNLSEWKVVRDTEDALELITDIKDSKEERESYLRCVQTSIFVFFKQCQRRLLNDGLFIVRVNSLLLSFCCQILPLLLPFKYVCTCPSTKIEPKHLNTATTIKSFILQNVAKKTKQHLFSFSKLAEATHHHWLDYWTILHNGNHRFKFRVFPVHECQQQNLERTFTSNCETALPRMRWAN